MTPVKNSIQLTDERVKENIQANICVRANVHKLLNRNEHFSVGTIFYTYLFLFRQINEIIETALEMDIWRESDHFQEG